MKIQSVRIRSFRALGDVKILFDSVTTFIGPNGAGKSTVLRALDWFFNGKPSALTEEDCSFGAADKNIEVEVTFSDLTEKDREALGHYAPEDATSFTAWRRRLPDGTDRLSANAKSFPAFNAIKAAPSATVKKQLYTNLLTSDPSLGLPSVRTAEDIKQALIAWEAANTDQLVDAPEALQTNFFGFNSGGVMSGLFDFVLITADLRASEEATDVKSSIIGRILERSIDRTLADAEIAIIVDESKAKQRKVYEEKFKSQLETMTTQLNSVISSYSPGRCVTVSPIEFEIKAPKTTFKVGVLDGMTETAIERQGHGFQRTVLISALQLLAQSGTASTEGVICLAIEEPELFQHPIQAQAFAKVLRSLADDPDKRIQVTYATHSPYFLEARYFNQVRRLTRSTDANPAVSVHHATISGVKKRLDGIVKATTVDNQLDNAIMRQLAIALFANSVFIVEGTTELAIFHGISDRISPGSLEAAGISIVDAQGKTSIPLIHAILTSMGIPAYALFDGDAGFEIRAKANGKVPEKIEEERRSNVASNRTLLTYFGQPVKDFPSATIAHNVAIFEDHLEGFLLEKWPEWTVACTELETMTGIKLKKNQNAYRIVTLRAQGEVPEILLQIIDNLKRF